MAANVDPIYSKVGDIQIVQGITAAFNAINLTTGTLASNVNQIFLSDATNGGFVRNVRIKAQPANNSAATVARIYFSTSANPIASATTSVLITELGIPATTASATAALPDFDIPLNIAMPPGTYLYITFGTAPGGSAAFSVTTFGGKY